jgi:hypothetical protein
MLVIVSRRQYTLTNAFLRAMLDVIDRSIITHWLGKDQFSNVLAPDFYRKYHRYPAHN